MELLKRLLVEEEGQGMVEYALIIALIAVMLITVLGSVRAGIDSAFDSIVAALPVHP